MLFCSTVTVDIRSVHCRDTLVYALVIEITIQWVIVRGLG